ncbi:hypothetical protein MTR67_009189, partial [Solanum verrucosum]
MFPPGLILEDSRMESRRAARNWTGLGFAMGCWTGFRSQRFWVHWFLVPREKEVEQGGVGWRGAANFAMESSNMHSRNFNSLVKFLTPASGLQGYWDLYPIDMVLRPPCMVLSTIGISKPVETLGIGLFTTLFRLGCWATVHSSYYYLTIQMVAGLFQPTGCPSVVAMIGNWFCKEEICSNEESANLSTLFDVKGVVGGILTGYISDQFDDRAITTASFIESKTRVIINNPAGEDVYKGVPK